MKDLTTQNIKPLIVPASLLTILAIALIVVGNIIFTQVTAVESQIVKRQAESAVLSQKIEVLKKVDEAIEQGADRSYFAVPSSNPATVALSQLRKAATNAVVSIGRLEVFSNIIPDSDVSQVTFEFEASGTTASLGSFLVTLKTLTPLLNIDRIEIESTDEVASMTASVNSFWSPLPSTLPAMSDTTTELSPEQLEILTMLSGFTYPEFGDPQTPSFSNESPRQEPFDVPTGVVIEE